MHFLSSAQCISEQYCSQGCTSIVLNVSVSQAGLAGLDDVVEQLPAIAYNEFLELLFC
jgi:hypothetical protein